MGDHGVHGRSGTAARSEEPDAWRNAFPDKLRVVPRAGPEGDRDGAAVAGIAASAEGRGGAGVAQDRAQCDAGGAGHERGGAEGAAGLSFSAGPEIGKSTRLNSSHEWISRM